MFAMVCFLADVFEHWRYLWFNAFMIVSVKRTPCSLYHLLTIHPGLRPSVHCICLSAILKDVVFWGKSKHENIARVGQMQRIQVFGNFVAFNAFADCPFCWRTLTDVKMTDRWMHWSHVLTRDMLMHTSVQMCMLYVNPIGHNGCWSRNIICIQIMFLFDDAIITVMLRVSGQLRRSAVVYVFFAYLMCRCKCSF